MRILAALAIAPILALSACASPAEPAAAPSAQTPSPTAPAPTSEPEAEPYVTELVIRGWGVEVLDDAGDIMGSFEWVDSTESSLDVLELALGPAPEPFIEAGDCCHVSDYEVYDFGALVYRSAVLDRPRDEYWLPGIVVAVAPETDDGIIIRAASGLQVGSTAGEVAAADPLIVQDRQEEQWHLLDPVDPAVVEREDQATDMLAAIAPPGGAVTSLRAPVPSRVFV